MCGPQRPPDRRAMVSDRHINSSPMMNTQSSGFHVVEINGNGAQTIFYWLLGIFVFFVSVGGSVYGTSTVTTQPPGTGKREKQEQDRRTQELERVGRGCHGRRHLTTDSSPPTYGHHPTLQESALNHSGSELAKALSALRLEQAQEWRSLLLAVEEREQYHSERLSRIERH